MKKLLGIVVLGLLWCNFSFAEKIIDMTNSVWKDTKSSYMGSITGNHRNTYNFFEGGSCSYSYWDLIYLTKNNCEWEQNGNIVKMNQWANIEHKRCYVGIISSRTIAWAKASCGSDVGYGKKETSKAQFVEKYLDNTNNQNSIGIIKKTSLTDKKNTCQEIGFSPNTDPFANCVLKLMEIEENQANRSSQEQIANAQSLIEQEIAKEGRDQEAWKILLGMVSTTGSTTASGGLFSTGGVSCNKTGETTSGTNKICYYNCMGSTKTINVGSMQFCPININK